MFSEYSEIIVAIVATAISAFATYMLIHIKKPDVLLHDDKNEWRTGLREWITRFSNIKLNAIINSTKGDSISSLRDDLIVMTQLS